MQDEWKMRLADASKENASFYDMGSFAANKDEVEFAQKIVKNEDDKLVFLAPVYWTNVPGRMKLFFDEVFSYGIAYCNNAKLKFKTVYVLMTASNDFSKDDGKAIEHQIKKMFAFMNINDVVIEVVMNARHLKENDVNFIINRYIDILNR